MQEDKRSAKLKLPDAHNHCLVLLYLLLLLLLLLVLLPQGEDALAPIKILIDELRNEDFQQRLKSVRRLTTISTALGPERTREELVPYLNEMAAEHEDEDEVLLAMAEELGKLVEHVGGAQHAHVLLLPLETLCAPEEAMVRDKAVESLNAIAAVLPNLEPYMVPLIRRLAVGDYNSTRIASAPLFALVYKRVSDASKAEMRQMFAQLFHFCLRLPANFLGENGVSHFLFRVKTHLYCVFVFVYVCMCVCVCL